MDKIKKNIKILTKKINKLNKLYYENNTQYISDEKYDYYIKKLIYLENKRPDLINKNSPTQCFFNNFKNKLKKVNHNSPMLSLDNTYKEKDIKNFIKKNLKKNFFKDNISYCCELKIDGLAVSIIYKNKNLIQISTRGDGKIGENVTKNSNMIKNIPNNLKNYKNVPNYLELRGEVFMLKNNFLKLNKKLKKKNKKTFSSLRNAASGSLRRINSLNILNNKLNFFCYGINWSKKSNFPESHFECLKILKNFGIPINKNIKICKNFQEIINYYLYFMNFRKKLDFDIDGIVIKLDNQNLQKKIGNSSKAPKWAIAYKFPSKEGITILKKVDFQIGRTGIITPVARLKPIYISGIKISNVTLHNFNEINKLNIMIGDTVVISRAGDVIPKLKNVIKKYRPKNAKKIKFPDICPVCKSLIKKINNDVNLYCLNYSSCIAQSKERLNHFVSRKAMNIQGFGKKIINYLVNKKIATNPVELFKLDLYSLLRIKRVNIKLAKKLLESLKKSKNTTLQKFIYSLGIPKVGFSLSNNLANHYKKIDLLINSDISSLISIQDIGINIAYKIYSFFRIKENLKMIESLISEDIGIKF